MIEKLLELGEGRLLIPVLFVVAGVAILKAIFSLHRTKSADRRDFLELWAKTQERDDVWLEVAVRHLFGTYLPSSIIRSLMQAPQSGRALLEVSEFWDLIEIDDETLQLRWKNSEHAFANERTRRAIGLTAFYCVAMGIGLLCVFIALLGITTVVITVSLLVYALVLALIAFRALHRAEMLRTANTAAPRWLGLT